MSRTMELEGNELTFNNGDLRGLPAPQVPLKKLRETLRVLRYSAVNKMLNVSNLRFSEYVTCLL